jgi:hypothetical protein
MQIIVNDISSARMYIDRINVLVKEWHAIAARKETEGYFTNGDIDYKIHRLWKIENVLGREAFVILEEADYDLLEESPEEYYEEWKKR